MTKHDFSDGLELMQVVDAETGEIFQVRVKDLIDKRSSAEDVSNNQNDNGAKYTEYGIQKDRKRDKSKQTRPQWMKVSIASLQHEASMPIFSRTERVWKALIASMNYKNHAYCSQGHLTKLTGISQSHVSSAIKELETYNMLLKRARGDYWINPACAYCGPDSKKAEAVAAYQALFIRKKETEMKKVKTKIKKPRLKLVIDNATGLASDR